MGSPGTSVSLSVEAHLAGKLNERGRVEVDNGLERAGIGVLKGLGSLTVNQLKERGEDVGPPRDRDDVLRDLVMSQGLVLGDGLDEFKIVGADHGTGQADDRVGDGSGNKHSLADLFAGVGEVALDLIELPLKAGIKHSVGLVKDQSRQVGGPNVASGVLEQIVETARGGNQKVAALSAGLMKHLTLISAADSALDNETSVGGQPASLDSNLLSEFSSGRQDNATDIIRLGLASGTPVGECRILVDHSLQQRQEEGKRLSGTSLGLCDT